MHWFLSPHADDAALSCGGQIAQLVRNGVEVGVLTVMAGDPPANFPDNAYTRELWERWNAGEMPTIRRRDEDTAAVRLLGASLRFGSYADAVYRLDPMNGQPLYPDRAAIFGDGQPNDPILPIADLPALQPGDILHAPLGVGHHVDHQIVRDAAAALSERYTANEVYFYEDYPYIYQDAGAVHPALQHFKQPLTRIDRPADDLAVEAKIAAIACYRSQLSTFWVSEKVMADQIRTWMADRGEREWRLIRSIDSE